MLCFLRGCKANEFALQAQLDASDIAEQALNERFNKELEQCDSHAKSLNKRIDEQAAEKQAYMVWAENEIDKLTNQVNQLRSELNAGLAPQKVEDKCIVTDEGDMLCIPHKEEECAPATN